MTQFLPSVCILTAGTGRRSGPFADIINKCLLPYRGKAIISSIIELFPAGTEFVVGLGYKAEQVRAYLSLMHPDIHFVFVEVDNYAGPGSGPGHSLSCCRKNLPGPFYFVAGDGVFENIPRVYDKNWLGIAPHNNVRLAAYCNIAYDKNELATAVYDKMEPPQSEETGIFTGLMFIKDDESFWRSLEGSAARAGEKQISGGFDVFLKEKNLYVEKVRWQDLGTFELYKAAMEEVFDFGKTNEFIYLSERRVVKFFADEKITGKRVEKSRLAPGVFPHITGEGGQFFAYDKVAGNTMYERLDEELFRKLLPWLKKELWKLHDVPTARMARICESFYRDKTRQRLVAYQEKYPNVAEPKYVNDRPVEPMENLMRKLPASLYDGVAAFIHGDLQFDNIITDGNNFTLIDWRQDFAGEVAFGDWYYDLAKLLGGIYLNYDYIKKGMMSFEQDAEKVSMSFSVRKEAPTYAEILREFVEKEGLDFTRVEILRGLIYLNMAPLHHPPFDRLLYALSQVTLTEALK